MDGIVTFIFQYFEDLISEELKSLSNSANMILEHLFLFKSCLYE